MLVYGDRSRTALPTSLMVEIRRCCDAAQGAAGPARLDLLTRALITAGELAQGTADAERDATGEDDCTAPIAATMALAIAIASDLLAAAGTPTGSRPDIARALAVIRGLPLPPRIRCKTPEGFAFYALYPEDYAAAAVAASPAPTIVIGLRSIGTSLAAAVAARLGCPAITLRPCGHPFHRHIRAAPALRRLLARHPGRFVIVDEGPGLSGSSFGAAADLLEDLGVPLGRMLFLTSHANELGPCATPAHRARWARSERVVAASAISPRTVQGWFADVTGRDAHVEDLSGGAWRADLPEPAWPPVAPVAERLKFRLSSPETGNEAGNEASNEGGTEGGTGRRFVARFAGLGAAGEEKLAVARRLHAAGFVPEPLALRRGFLLERWSEGRPLEPNEPKGERFLEHLGRYLGFRAGSLPAGEGDGASFPELCRMAVVNAAEMGGPDLGRKVEARLAEAGGLAGLVPARTDGRLHIWEWLRLPDGSFVKTDGLDHAVAHDLIGCQDIAWDVAGAAIEFDLAAADIERLRVAVGAVAGREVSRPAMAAFRICYAAFQGGLWAMTGESGTVGRARMEVLCHEYLAALRRAVEAGPGRLPERLPGRLPGRASGQDLLVP